MKDIDRSGGFIKFWRCFVDERIFINPPLWQLWTWCLVKANHQDKTWEPASKGGSRIVEIEIKRGQFLFGRNTASKSLKVSGSTIWKRMLKLERLGFLDMESDRQGTIVTICNYDSMCESAMQRVTSKRTTSGRPVDTTKNVKNVKNIKEDDFELLWRDYPPEGRDGKKLALRAYLKSVRSGDDLKHIKMALSNYKAHLVEETWKRPKNGSTWFNNWRDWVDWSKGTVHRGVVL